MPEREKPCFPSDKTPEFYRQQLEHPFIRRAHVAHQLKSMQLAVSHCMLSLCDADGTGHIGATTLSVGALEKLHARLCRLAVFNIANDCRARKLLIPRNDVGSTNKRFAIHRISEKVEEAYDAWKHSVERDAYIAEKDYPFVQEALANPHVDPDVHLSPNLECINRQGQMSRWDAFERVRSATYRVINGANYRAYLPRIEESYERSLLDAGLLQQTRDHPDQLPAFMQRAEKGVFVFGFREQVGDKPSVKEQMEHDFEMSGRPDAHPHAAEHPRYEGRCLEDEKGELLSWFTFWHTPRSKSGVHRDALLDYLGRGTSGTISFRYNGYDEMVQVLDNVTRIDTIWRDARTPFGACRLFAKAVQDILHDNPDQKRLLGYRLEELFTDPPISSYLPHKQPPRLAINLSSADFFSERGCLSIGDDYDPGGPASRRTLPDGSSMSIRPAWMVFTGLMDTVHRRSIDCWRKLQRKYGDVTSDGLDDCPDSQRSPTLYS